MVGTQPREVLISLLEQPEKGLYIFKLEPETGFSPHEQLVENSDQVRLFEQLADTGHQLVNHQWTPREQFLQLCEQMDIGLQVSFSETFNIVGADLISQGVPIVGSTEIPWAVHPWCADPTSTADIVNKLEFAYNWPKLNVFANQISLKNYTNKTAKIWYNYCKGK